MWPRWSGAERGRGTGAEGCSAISQRVQGRADAAALIVPELTDSLREVAPPDRLEIVERRHTILPKAVGGSEGQLCRNAAHCAGNRGDEDPGEHRDGVAP